MKRKDSKYSLQRTMIIYFLLIGFASMLVSFEFIWDTHKGSLKKDLLENFEKFDRGKIPREQVFSPIEKLRNKAILMVIIILAVMIIILTMFIKNITEPLQHMIEISKEIDKGDLSQTIRLHSENELQELGNVINGLSSNLQEVTLISKNLCNSLKEFISKAEIIGEKNNIDTEDIQQVIDDIRHLGGELTMLTEMIDFFDFYTVEEKDGD